MRKFFLLLSILLLVGCTSLFEDDGCNPGFHKQNNVCVEDYDGTGIFKSSDDILNLILTENKKQGLIYQQLGTRNSMFFDTGAMLESSATDNMTTYTSKGSDDYSETNNQVDGVDEMDNVLTDGKYIYISNYNKVQIILAYTELEQFNVLDIVKEISFENIAEENSNFYFNGMYVDQDRLLLIGTKYSYHCTAEYVGNLDDKESEHEDDYTYCQYYEYHNSTFVWEYAKEDFSFVNEYELSGSFVGSRKIEDNVYIVTNEYIPSYYTENEELTYNIDDYIPHYMINNQKVQLPYSSIRYIDGTTPTTFTTFYGIGLESKQISTEVVLGEGGYNLYVSSNNIYLTGTKWNYNEDVLLELEKAENPEDVEIDEDPYTIETSIIRVEIKKGVVDFAAEGTVPGSALDQFAMDENNDHVRIVTTTGNFWWWGNTQEINNRLIILDLDLKIVSQLDGLGKEGESVQSTRFVGDYAYVVTFLRTDPFYVIDLRNPNEPKKLSELEIPGFSDYLQPINEDLILGIGYGDLKGGTQGLKISLYDVSNKNDAVVTSEIIYPYEDNGYIWTSTVYNHKDLLVSIEKGIISLPYTEYDWNYSNNTYKWTYHTGVLVLNLDIEAGLISERAKVEHSEADYHDIYVYKSKFIDTYLYTISSKYIKVSTIEEPQNVLSTLKIGESKQLYYGEVIIVD